MLLLVPAVVPTVHDVSVATPDASVATVPPDAGLVEPPPAVTVKVTATPAPTGLLNWSRTMTDGGDPTAEPIVADCDVTLFATTLLAAALTPDAVNVMVGRPATLAVTTLLLVPAV